jgi:dihydrofolate reductase
VKQHLFVFPLTLGAGRRLFAEGGRAAKFELAAAESYTSGAIHLTYHPVE